MSNSTIYETLRTKLNTLAGKPSIAMENEDFTPTPGTIYLRENFLPASTVPIGLSELSSKDYRGIYQVTVCGEAGYGTYNLRTWAEEILELFAVGKLDNDIYIESGSIAPIMIVDGWCFLPVSINYRAVYGNV